MGRGIEFNIQSKSGWVSFSKFEPTCGCCLFLKTAINDMQYFVVETTDIETPAR